ncbi:Manganese transport protein MntH [Marinilactibacillus psychrotolerans 42ea]|nr:Manganese transport protein MntH [Marinilactibacillus psychrotolerans 42ea]
MLMMFLKEGGNILKDTTSQSGKEHKPRLIQHANGPSLE